MLEAGLSPALVLWMLAGAGNSVERSLSPPPPTETPAATAEAPAAPPPAVQSPAPAAAPAPAPADTAKPPVVHKVKPKSAKAEPDPDSLARAKAVAEATAAAQAAADSIAAAADSASEGDSTAAPAEAEAPRPPLWVEVYSEATRSHHDDDNTEGFGELKLGRRFDLKVPVDIYGKVRIFRDQRDFFWNNKVLGGVGVQASILKSPLLRAFAQVTEGSFLRNDQGTVTMSSISTRVVNAELGIDAAQTRFEGIIKAIGDANILAQMNDPSFRDTIRVLVDSADKRVQRYSDQLTAVLDTLDALDAGRDSLQQSMDSLALIPAGELTEVQAGLVFWYGWGGPVNQEGAWFSFPLRFWGEVYSDCIYLSQRRHVLTRGGGEAYRDSTVRLDNLILYVNPDVGYLVMDGRAGSLAAYLTGYFWTDTHGDWWNNRFMAGPGLKWQPLPLFDFSINAEYLVGRYYRDRNDDPLPYHRSFKDLRIGANFWYGLGI